MKKANFVGGKFNVLPVIKTNLITMVTHKQFLMFAISQKSVYSRIKPAFVKKKKNNKV